MKHYSLLLSLTPFSPEEVLKRILGDEYEKTVEEWVRTTGIPRIEIEVGLLRHYLYPPRALPVDESDKQEWLQKAEQEAKMKPRKKRGWRKLYLTPAVRARNEKAHLIKEWLEKNLEDNFASYINAKEEAASESLSEETSSLGADVTEEASEVLSLNLEGEGQGEGDSGEFKESQAGEELTEKVKAIVSSENET